ncbi:aminomethyltransferase [Methylacidimicrobium cyclopophantes]|uniref:aminomethyltransferase n=2 Tax=Methylacidimicrobium cyclopophantes TaxID=1041766 RepID=A0A5E6MB24_9BACT|nr:aminomethyltransferase [Methylacidimicrobium cyclopophantes]
MGDFAGWYLPIVYTSVAEEVLAVRRAAGLFDICHMGELLLSGPDAEEWLDRLLPSRMASLSPGRGRYSMLLQDDGGIIDDLFVYRIDASRFFLVVNAATTETDFRWFSERLSHAGTTVANESERWGGLALQGPEAWRILRRVIPDLPATIERRAFLSGLWNGVDLWIARTGYTGEDGAELFFPLSLGPGLWDALLEEGASSGIRPCGLAARDILRLEACLPLNGHELRAEITPLEARLAWVVDWEKPDSFPGRKALEERKRRGTEISLVAFEVDGPAPPPRTGYDLLAERTVVGQVTSGGFSPTLGTAIGMGYVQSPMATVGSRLAYAVRGHSYRVTVKAPPLYRRKSQ